MPLQIGGSGSAASAFRPLHTNRPVQLTAGRVWQPAVPLSGLPPIQPHPWRIIAGGQPRQRGRVQTYTALPPEPAPIQPHPWHAIVGGQPRHRGKASSPAALPPTAPILRARPGRSWQGTDGAEPVGSGFRWVLGRRHRALAGHPAAVTGRDGQLGSSLARAACFICCCRRRRRRVRRHPTRCGRD